ncbi:hypothetical protein P171DRAFT_479367 [Karstenula rhodostoma CBS 690.94]|uniref:Uncharacterized protein n=1 Tax=Karstenula rhodostoma CBS 690.94 TaxID=1392251 RepID=A0A9P4UI48_9PLEO|nr:hypothetical protein P171DRAFT_479367 [Karstenula rhodostoma CBS 690.94]
MSGYPTYPNDISFPYRPRPHPHPHPHPHAQHPPAYLPLSVPVNSTHSNEHEGIRRKLEELDGRLKGVDELMRQVKRCAEDMKRSVEQQYAALEELLRRVQEDVEGLRDGVRVSGRRRAGYGRAVTDL